MRIFSNILAVYGYFKVTLLHTLSGKVGQGRGRKNQNAEHRTQNAECGTRSKKLFKGFNAGN
jgi:hypothetical protein